MRLYSANIWPNYISNNRTPLGRYHVVRLCFNGNIMVSALQFHLSTPFYASSESILFQCTTIMLFNVTVLKFRHKWIWQVGFKINLKYIKSISKTVNDPNECVISVEMLTYQSCKSNFIYFMTLMQFLIQNNFQLNNH